MGLIKAFSGALNGAISDQWLDIYTVRPFDEHTLVSPASKKNGIISDVITTGSKIYVPDNTCAIIINQSGIEEIIKEPGGYEYTDGEASIFNGNSINDSIIKEFKERFKFSGYTPQQKIILFVNLKEIRNIKFGTRGPLMYYDSFYDVDLEILSYGTFSIKVNDPVKLITNFVPANMNSYSIDNENVRSQLIAEFLQSFMVALNSLSGTYRISQIPSQAIAITQKVKSDLKNVGSWSDRFGFEIISVAIENIKFTNDSRELVHNYASTKMDMRAYEDISENTSNIRAQQKIAEGIKEKGLGNTAGMFMGMNIGQSINPFNARSSSKKQELSLDEQIEILKKLKDLVDAGILTQEEFEIKKKQIMKL